MSLLNGGLKFAISALNLLDIYKALTSKASSSLATSHASKDKLKFSDLGQSISTTIRTTRQGDGTPVKSLQTKYRTGTLQRREQLKRALSLAIVWSIFQTVEPLIDTIAGYIVPFYASLKLAFLCWIFFSRTAASSRLLHLWIAPTVRPYEPAVDAVLAHTLVIFFNAIFLLSIPISKALIWVRQGPWQSAQKLYKRLPWAGEPDIVARARARVKASSTPARVPPPSKRRPPRRPPSEEHVKPHLNGSSADADGNRDQVSVSLSGKTVEKKPSFSRLGGPASTLPRSQTMSNFGLGKPPLAAASNRAVSSSARSVSASASSRSTSQGKSAASPASQAASLQALYDLPAVPQGFTTQGNHGSFAFIPPSTPAKSADHLESSPAVTAIRAGLFSPIVPGAFSMPQSDRKSPLVMPTEAKAKKTKSSLSLQKSAKGDKKENGVVKGNRRAVATAAAAKAEKKDTGLFLGSDESDADGSVPETDSVQSTPRKRKITRTSTTNQTPSLADGGGDAEADGLPTKAKKSKLQVLEDPQDSPSISAQSGSQIPTRRGRAAGIGTGAGTRSRAGSVGPLALPPSTATSTTALVKDAPISRPPSSSSKSTSTSTVLRPSSSTRTLRPSTSRSSLIPISQPSSSISTKLPPLSGGAKAIKASASSRNLAVNGTAGPVGGMTASRSSGRLARGKSSGK